MSNFSSSSIIDIKSARNLVDASLRPHIKSCLESAASMHPSYLQLWQTIDKLLFSGGKRIRPYITLLTYQALSGNEPNKIADIASSQELLHLALLIHDDIIDRDYVRYGMDNISGQYQKIYEPYINSSIERLHYSDSMATLAGDLLISGAYQMIANSKASAKQKQSASTILGEAIFIVAGGELLDTESAFMSKESSNPLLIAKHKTAHYSFVTSLLIGATLAEANEQTTNSLKTFGYQIGVAYQLVDDILGVFGDEIDTGKSNFGDIKEAKYTYLIEAFDRLATDQQKQQFYAHFGNSNLTRNQADEAKTLLSESGAKSAVEQKINELTDEAKQSLANIEMSSGSRLGFENLILSATKRSY